VRRRFSRAVETLLLAVALAAPALAETLREALAHNGISLEGLAPADLDRAITSFAALNEAPLFAIAYYVDAGDASLPHLLHVCLLERPAGQWRRRTLEYGKLIPGEPDFYTGSVTGITHTRVCPADGLT